MKHFAVGVKTLYLVSKIHSDIGNRMRFEIEIKKFRTSFSVDNLGCHAVGKSCQRR